ncbi:membrane protein, partial [Cellulomonas bogoriensis 69B4 = DSM 16987]
AVGRPRGEVLRRAGRALVLGSDWAQVWEVGEGLEPVARALRPAWQDGVPAVPALRDAADRHRRERQGRALEEAGRLGVRLVLPLGLCHLPAFVLVGLVPVLVSMASGLG